MTLKFVDEYRDSNLARSYADQISQIVSSSSSRSKSRAQPWRMMEVCGGQTHSIVKFGIDQILPPEITLIHGPGCPVCVTPTSVINSAIELASRPEVILCSFGDMLRVPGTHKDLIRVKADGGDVRIVYSPLDCLKISHSNPDREVVFFAIGFETTAPANAMAAYLAKKQGIKNFSMLVSQVLVPPALEAILSSRTHQVDGLLAPGHVCTIVGYEDYHRLSEKYRIPIVVTGFEPADILQGIAMCARQLEEGRFEVENQYTRSVSREGNRSALLMMAEVFEVSPQTWRGLGNIDASGLRLSRAYRDLDAVFRFHLGSKEEEEDMGCMSGLVLQGVLKPTECPEFGKKCNPDRPLGATMVSSEGACAAYYRYRGHTLQEANGSE